MSAAAPVIPDCVGSACDLGECLMTRRDQRSLVRIVSLCFAVLYGQISRKCRPSPRIKSLSEPGSPGFIGVRAAGQAGHWYLGELGRTAVNCNPDCNPPPPPPDRQRSPRSELVPGVELSNGEHVALAVFEPGCLTDGGPRDAIARQAKVVTPDAGLLVPN